MLIYAHTGIVYNVVGRAYLKYFFATNRSSLSAYIFQLHAKLTENAFGYKALQAVKKRTDVKDYGTRYSHANIDTKHSIREEEQTAFAKWLSR